MSAASSWTSDSGQGHLDLVEVGLEDQVSQLAGRLGVGAPARRWRRSALSSSRVSNSAGLLGEVVVQPGQDLGLGLLDQDRKVTSRPASSSPASSGRGGVEA